MISLSCSALLGMTDVTDTSHLWSNYGTCVDLFAPGADILSVYPNEETHISTGTSGAAAFVAGSVARFASAQEVTPTPIEVWADDFLSLAIPPQIVFQKNVT